MIWSKPDTIKEEMSFLEKLWSKPDTVKEEKTSLSYFWSTSGAENFWSKIGWKEVKETEKDKIEELDSMTKAAQMANAAQTRYSFIKPPNSRVVTAVTDNKYGTRIIRFNYPAVTPNSKSNFSRVVVDPRGFPNKNNTHIPVPSALVTSTGYIHSAFRYFGNALVGISILLNGVRLAEASQNERGVISEAVLISAEYVGSFIGGGTGATVGAAVGTVGGPVGSVFGAVIFSILGSHYALNMVKSRERFIVENAKLMCLVLLIGIYICLRLK